MADAETVGILAWIDTLPMPTPDSCWDGIFLCPIEERGFEVMLAWLWGVYINPQGELHQEFVGSPAAVSPEGQ